MGERVADTLARDDEAPLGCMGRRTAHRGLLERVESRSERVGLRDRRPGVGNCVDRDGELERGSFDELDAFSAMAPKAPT